MVTAGLLGYNVAVQTGYSDCADTKRRWQRYIDNSAIPFLNKLKYRDMKSAVQRDDSDYHATLLKAFNYC